MDQEVVLKLIASLDQGSVKSDVANLASSMSREMEQVFQKMGENIVNVISQSMGRVLKDTVRQATDPNQMSFGFGSSAKPGAGMPTPNATDRVFGGDAPMQQKPYGVGDFRGGYTDVWKHPNSSAASFVGDLLKNKTGAGVLGDEGMLDPRTAANRDATYARARMIQTSQKAGIDVPLSADDRKVFANARDDVSRSMAELPKVVERLTEELKNNAIRIGKLDKTMARPELDDSNRLAIGTKKKNLNDRNSQILDEMGQAQTIQQSNAQQMGVFNNLAQGPSKMDQFRGIAGALAPLLASAGQLPGQFRASQVGFANAENMQGRAAMSGDINRLMAIDMAGGQASLQRQGNFEAGLGVAGNLAGAIASGASTMIPIPGMQVAGALGAATMGANAVGGVANFGANVNAAIENNINTEQGKHAELFESMGKSRSFIAGNYETALGMGTPEIAGILNAGMENESATTDSLAPIQSRINMLKGIDMSYMTPDYAKEKQQEIAQLEEQARGIETSKPSTIVGLGASAGFSPAETSGFISKLAGRSGGVYQGSSILEGQDAGIGSLLNIAKQGGMGGFETAGTLTKMDGGQDFKKAVEQTKDLWQEIIGGGFDKSSGGRVLAQVAANAASLGLGGGDIAVRQQQMSNSIAQQTFGQGVGGQVSDQQLQMGERVVAANQRQGSSLGTLQSSYKSNAIEKTFREFGAGKDLSTNKLLYLTHGGNLEAQDAGKYSDKFKDPNSKETQAFIQKLRERSYEAVQQANKLGLGKVSSVLANSAAGSSPGAMMDMDRAMDLTPGAVKEVAGPAKPGDNSGLKQRELEANMDLKKISATFSSFNKQLDALASGIGQYTTKIMEELAKLNGGRVLNPIKGGNAPNQRGQAPGSTGK